jgi:hypothetical protein
MSFRFKLNEPIAKGVSRIGLEQIAAAEAALARGKDIATGIHDARRCLKRLRALLRLARPALDEHTYRREMRRLAGIGRMLAQARDAHVMQQTLAKLEDRFGTLPKGAALLPKLMPTGAGPRKPRTHADARRQALAGLEQARTFFSAAEGERIAFEHVAEGLERTYRKARKAFHEAYRRPTDEAFHAWRKSVQQHWRHMQLLSRGWPDVLSGRAGEAKELSRLLGDDHDLAVLAAFAAKRGAGVLSADARNELSRLCRSCQAEIRELAKPHGQRLLVEPAKDLGARVGLYWSAAARLSALALAAGEPRSRAQVSASTTARRGRTPAVASGARSASRGSSGGKARRPGR